MESSDFECRDKSIFSAYLELLDHQGRNGEIEMKLFTDLSTTFEMLSTDTLTEKMKPVLTEKL